MDSSNEEDASESSDDDLEYSTDDNNSQVDGSDLRQEQYGLDLQGPSDILGLRLWDGIMNQGNFDFADKQVERLVNQYLSQAWSEWDKTFLGGYDPLGSSEVYAAEFGLNAYYANEAFNLASDYRQYTDSLSQSARDAQYFLRGYQAGLSGDKLEILEVLAAPFYEATKLLAHGLEDLGYGGLERAIELGPNHTSPVGYGWLWAWVGLERGIAEGRR